MHVPFPSIVEIMPQVNALSSDARLKLLEEHVSVGTWTADSKLTDVTWSQGMYRLLGFDAQLVNPSMDLLRSVVHPEDRTAFEGLLAFSQARSTAKRLFRIIRVDGTQRYILGKSQAHFTRDGAERLMFGVFIDFTAETEEIERSRITKTLLSVTSHLLGGHPWITDPRGKLLDAAHWEALTGISIGTEGDWSERMAAVHPDDRHKFSTAWQTALSNAIPYAGTFRAAAPDGSFQTFNNRAEPVHGDDGKVLFWVGHSVPVSNAEALETRSGFGAAHVRAARGFLGWSAHELADRSGIPYGTIRRIEDGNSSIRPLHQQLLTQALSQHGIEFLDRHDGSILMATPKCHEVVDVQYRSS